MIAIDTGPLVAFFDKDDKYHESCLAILGGIHEPLVTTWAVLTEVFYLLEFSSSVQDALWEFVLRGGVTVVSPDEQDCVRCRDLMSKYADLPMDVADATLVAVAEVRRLTTVFTLDRRDFSVYRPIHRRRFALLPERL